MPAALLQSVQNCSFIHVQFCSSCKIAVLIHSLSLSTHTLRCLCFGDVDLCNESTIQSNFAFNSIRRTVISTRLDVSRLNIIAGAIENTTSNNQYNEDALCLLKQVQGACIRQPASFCFYALFTVHDMIVYTFDSELPSSCLLLQLQARLWFMLRASNLPWQ